MKIITVASAKGGVGKSTFCYGVGKMLSDHNKRVLLVDMDIGVRSLDILLGVSEKIVYNWGDIIKGNCDYRTVAVEAYKNLFVLPAPIDFSEEYNDEAFKKMISLFDKDFDFIFLDSPAGLESGFNLAANACDSSVVMSTPDAISLRAASYASEKIRKIGVTDIRIVINKFDKHYHKKIDVDEVIDTVGARLLGIIPDSDEVYASVNGEKIPYNSKGSQAFLRISERICGKNVPFRAKNIC